MAVWVRGRQYAGSPLLTAGSVVVFAYTTNNVAPAEAHRWAGSPWDPYCWRGKEVTMELPSWLRRRGTGTADAQARGWPLASQGVTAVATLAPLADGAPLRSRASSFAGSSRAGEFGRVKVEWDEGGKRHREKEGGGGMMTSVIGILQCF